ncbi:MAG: hypothetical protein WA090_04485 [Candidatus Nanopelagicaceae bacterium]
MLIDCDTCLMRDIACSDCVVSTLLATPGADLPEVSPATAAAIELLSSRGIVPPMRFLRVVQG